MGPRNVRNFWVDVDVDGKQNSVATGPRSADGGMDANFKIREAGTVTDSIDVLCRANGDTLTLTVQHNRRVVYEHITTR